MSAGPGWARIVAMSCLIAACDGGGDTDAGASPDGAVMDAGGGDDAGGDAGPIDGAR